MTKHLMKIALVLMGIAVGASAGFGWAYLQIKKERAVAEEKLKDAGRKMAQAQKKYTEERDGRIALDGKLRAVQAESVKTQKEMAALKEQIQKGAETTPTLEAKIRELTESLATYKVARDEMERKAVELAQGLRERNEEVKRLMGEKQGLDSDLKRTQQTLERCQEHNARLCVVAEELLERYEQKGVVTSVLQAEPFTQLKKVEIEKIAQDYRERIDQEKIRLAREQKKTGK